MKWYLLEAYKTNTNQPIGLLVLRARTKKECVSRVAQALYEENLDTFSTTVTRIPASDAAYLIHNGLVLSREQKGGLK